VMMRRQDDPDRAPVEATPSRRAPCPNPVPKDYPIIDIM
jgi:hypothetical protein